MRDIGCEYFHINAAADAAVLARLALMTLRFPLAIDFWAASGPFVCVCVCTVETVCAQTFG